MTAQVLVATKTDPKARIVSFWSGPVSWMERLSAKSMRRQGHTLTVYSYAPHLLRDGGLEADIRDARDMLPLTGEHARLVSASPALLSDIFRLELMRQNSGVWLDLDMLMVAPLIAPAGPIFAVEGPRGAINNAALYLPADSNLLADMSAFVAARPVRAPWWTGKRRLKHAFWATVRRPIPPEDCQWGVFGPKALTWFVDQNGMRAVAAAPETFYPVSWNDRAKLVSKDDVWRLCTHETVAVHLWANGLRKLIATSGVERESFLAQMARSLDEELPKAALQRVPM